MKIKIKVYVTTRYVGCEAKDTLEFDVEDGLTEKEIEEIKEEETRIWMFDQIEFGWSDVE
jgi:metal-sulfur cluster biosynthetic enzyme